MISKVQQISQQIGVKLKNVENMSKSKWKKQVKEKIGKSKYCNIVSTPLARVLTILWGRGVKEIFLEGKVGGLTITDRKNVAS